MRIRWSAGRYSSDRKTLYTRSHDGSRHRSYCLLLLSHVDVDEADLREQAAKYSFEAEIDALLRYLETEGEVNDYRFPEWDVFQELATDYKIES